MYGLEAVKDLMSRNANFMLIAQKNCIHSEKLNSLRNMHCVQHSNKSCGCEQKNLVARGQHT
jgi:hypothetical protein